MEIGAEVGRLAKRSSMAEGAAELWGEAITKPDDHTVLACACGSE